jgi:hypothetical protein
MIHRIDPPLPLDTPRGKAFAHFLLDYGTEHNLMWICFLREDGACWTFPNPEVRLAKNDTMGIRSIRLLS